MNKRKKLIELIHVNPYQKYFPSISYKYIGRPVKSFRKAKLVVKPKEKDICPRYHPNSIPYVTNSYIRNRNTAGRLDADKPKLAPTKLAPKPTPAIHTVKQTRPLSNDRNKLNTVTRNRSQTDKTKALGTSV